MGTTYHEDVVAWANEQAALLRAGRLDLIDIDHIADEIEDVGKSEQRELASRMAVLLMHLLKWQYQPQLREAHRASWLSTIEEQRSGIARRLKKTPSLKASLNDPDWWLDAWQDGVHGAVRETRLERATFPASCPWVVSQILDDDWLPDSKEKQDI